MKAHNLSKKVAYGTGVVGAIFMGVIAYLDYANNECASSTVASTNTLVMPDGSEYPATQANVDKAKLRATEDLSAYITRTNAAMTELEKSLKDSLAYMKANPAQNSTQTRDTKQQFGSRHCAWVVGHFLNDATNWRSAIFDKFALPIRNAVNELSASPVLNLTILSEYEV